MIESSLCSPVSCSQTSRGLDLRTSMERYTVWDWVIGSYPSILVPSLFLPKSGLSRVSVRLLCYFGVIFAPV